MAQQEIPRASVSSSASLVCLVMATLQDKVAIVTGASRGLGAGMALELARQGASVSLQQKPTWFVINRRGCCPGNAHIYLGLKRKLS